MTRENDKGSSSEMTILAIDCGSLTAFETLRAIKENEFGVHVSIVGVAYNDTFASRPLVDHPYECFDGMSDEHVSFLVDLCEKHDVDVVLPMSTPQLELICEHVPDFNDVGAEVMITHDVEKLRIANDKAMLAEFIGDTSFMPKSIVVADIEAAKAAPYELGYPDKPVCIKLVSTGGAVGFRIIDDREAKCRVIDPSRSGYYVSYEQFVEAYADNPQRILLQEYLPGREMSVCVLCDHGEPIYVMTHKNSHVFNSIPLSAVVEQDLFAENATRTVARMLGLEYNAGFGFKEDEHGIPKLIDVNPRITATCYLFAKCGINLGLFGIMQAMGIEYPKQLEPQYGLRLTRHYGATYSLNGELLRQ